MASTCSWRFLRASAVCLFGFGQELGLGSFLFLGLLGQDTLPKTAAPALGLGSSLTVTELLLSTPFFCHHDDLFCHCSL